MQNAQHQNIVGFIWNIANKLRGPYANNSSEPNNPT